MIKKLINRVSEIKEQFLDYEDCINFLDNYAIPNETREGRKLTLLERMTCMVGRLEENLSRKGDYQCNWCNGWFEYSQVVWNQAYWLCKGCNKNGMPEEYIKRVNGK